MHKIIKRAKNKANKYLHKANFCGEEMAIEQAINLKIYDELQEVISIFENYFTNTDNFKLGDKVEVWNSDRSPKTPVVAYFIAKQSGKYPYLVVSNSQELLNIHKGSTVLIHAYQQCKKI